jgi:hypothetical protein
MRNVKKSVKDFIKHFNISKDNTETEPVIKAMTEERIAEAFVGPLYDRINEIMEDALYGSKK